MNYPLGEAILGFAGGSHLDWRSIAAHRRVSATASTPLDGPTFAARLEAILDGVPPEVVAVQLNLLG